MRGGGGEYRSICMGIKAPMKQALLSQVYLSLFIAIAYILSQIVK